MVNKSLTGIDFLNFYSFLFFFPNILQNFTVGNEKRQLTEISEMRNKYNNVQAMC